MSSELIYTSVPRGLKPNTSGFSTAAATAGMSRPVMTRLESLSSYEFRFNISDPKAQLNPTNFAHTRVAVGSETLSILSRVAFSGADYSGRNNKIAHHFLLEAGELLPIGPAVMLARMEGRLFRSEWSGEPQRLPKQRLEALVPRDPPPPGPARHWQELTGDAGWAGMLAKAFRDNPSVPAFVLFNPGTDLLPLFEEALAVLPPQERWSVGFATYYTVLPTGCQYHWRGVLAGSSVEREIKRFPNALVINLTGPVPRAESNEFTEAARAGRTVASGRGAAGFAAAQTTVEPIPMPMGVPAEGQGTVRIEVPRFEDTFADVPEPAGAAASYRGVAPKKRAASPVLLVLVIILALANAATGWFLYSTWGDVDRMKREVQGLARQAADSALKAATLVVAEAGHHRDAAKEAADQATQAADTAAAAAERPEKAGEAALAEQEAKKAANRAGREAAHARRLAEDVGKLLEDLRKSQGGAADVDSITRQVELANAAAQDAEQERDRANTALTRKETVAPPPTATADVAAVQDLAGVAVEAAKKAVAAREKAKNAAGDAKAAADEAGKAPDQKKAKEAADKAKKAQETAEAAVTEAEEAKTEAAKAAGDAEAKAGKGPKDVIIENALKPAQEAVKNAQAACKEAAELAKDARKQAELAAGKVAVAPTATGVRDITKIKDLDTLLGTEAAKWKFERPKVNAGQQAVVSFDVGGATVFVNPPKAIEGKKLVFRHDPAGVLKMTGPKPSVGEAKTFITCRLKGDAAPRQLECTLEPDAADRPDLQWLVIEIADSAQKVVYQCLFARPPEVPPHKVTFGYSVEKKKVIVKNREGKDEERDVDYIKRYEATPLVIEHPWPDTLTAVLANSKMERGQAASGPKTTPFLLKGKPAEKGQPRDVKLYVESKPGNGSVEYQTVLESLRWIESMAKEAWEKGELNREKRADLRKTVAELDRRIDEAKNKREDSNGLQRDRVRPAEDLEKVNAELAKQAKSTKEMLEAVNSAIKETPQLQIRDAWGIPLATIQMEFKTCAVEKLIEDKRPQDR